MTRARDLADLISSGKVEASEIATGTITSANIQTATLDTLGKTEFYGFRYVDTNGDSVEFAIAPSLIRVIEASNTGDLVMLPVEKMIEFDLDGDINLTDEGYKIFENIIKRDAELIKNELDPL